MTTLRQQLEAEAIVDTWIVLDKHTKVLPVKKDRDEMKRRIFDALKRRDAEIQRLSNIIRDEGWAIPDGTLRLGLVNAQEENRKLTHRLEVAEAENKRLRDALGVANKLLSCQDKDGIPIPGIATDSKAHIDKHKESYEIIKKALVGQCE